MYILGWPIHVVIDDTLPFLKEDPEKLAFSQLSQDESYWGPLLEKAVAKYSGSYEDLNDTKNMDTAAEYFIMLTGAPFKIYSTNGEGD